MCERWTVLHCVNKLNGICFICINVPQQKQLHPYESNNDDEITQAPIGNIVYLSSIDDDDAEDGNGQNYQRNDDLNENVHDDDEMDNEDDERLTGTARNGQSNRRPTVKDLDDSDDDGKNYRKVLNDIIDRNGDATSNTDGNERRQQQHHRHSSGGYGAAKTSANKLDRQMNQKNRGK